MAEPLPQDIEDLHHQACENEQETYIDPHTGFTVFTSYGHWRRGKCCGSLCRHCPYDFVNVRKRTPKRPLKARKTPSQTGSPVRNLDES
eukprot:CAMPEP_0201533354 /NCGR_PEP_ID=MMETSP0161_2-20130828/52954_1 /ASSEMBLY_ACC=CAM_ASM_000251 /TAXON_ID=180227 /ORGANISM="Neoparamoeba aestuarina, Strain SoJaBio B1-5/56/2" /LENGTH=88 /DNA_ID=CAMNT_0047937309 /DNA_START=86 /DNA_END=352 /DNA_ORIENTATION=-